MMARSVLQQIPSLTTHPLFSIIITSSILILLYLPRCFLPFLLSPVPISTVILLATLLHFGPKSLPSSAEHQQTPVFTRTVDDVHGDNGDDDGDGNKKEEKEKKNRSGDLVWSQKVIFPDEFLGWCVGGPLEVIYEECDGEEEENAMEHMRRRMDLRFTDSDDSGNDFDDRSCVVDSPENICFRWVEMEDDEEEMIEISLDEENLIEIDLTTFR